MTEATQEASVTTESPPSEKNGLLRGLARLFRHPVETTMKTVRDSGVGVTGVVVTIVILGILAAIGGPPLWRLITDAREHKLNSNLQEAAQVVRDRLTLEPEWMAETGALAGVSGANGAPNTAMLTALVEDLPFTWENTWPLTPGTDSDETIKMQFIDHDTTVNVALAANNVPPKADWLLADWRAVRVQAGNSDGAWACALIVIRPNVPEASVYLATASDNIEADSFVTNPTSFPTTAADQQRTMNAWLGGIWYDSGESYATGTASEQHCSPVGETGTPKDDHTWLPMSANAWLIDSDGGAAATADRTFSRNL